MLAVGVWMKIDAYANVPMYMDLTSVYYPAAPYILIAVGSVVIVVGLLGCLCTVCGMPALLYLVSFCYDPCRINHQANKKGLSLRPSKKFGPQNAKVTFFNRHCSSAKIYFCVTYSFSIEHQNLCIN